MLAEGFLDSSNFPNHVCGFYDSHEVRDDIVVAFLQDGLDKGDKCVCFVPHGTALEERISARSVAASAASSQLEFRNADEAYLDNGSFSRDVMLERLEKHVTSAMRDGYSFTRLVGDMSWVIRNRIDPQLVVAYEAQVNEFVRRFPQVALCLYDLAEFDGSIVVDVLRTHPKIIMNGMIVDNPYFVPVGAAGKV
jgi:hypothetical protein